jgi:hypothetical protein
MTIRYPSVPLDLTSPIQGCSVSSSFTTSELFLCHCVCFSLSLSLSLQICTDDIECHSYAEISTSPPIPLASTDEQVRLVVTEMMDFKRMVRLRVCLRVCLRACVGLDRCVLCCALLSCCALLLTTYGDLLYALM